MVSEHAYVDLETENLFPWYREAISDLTARLAAQPGVAGLVLLGGLAAGGRRQFMDRYSDLDMSVFVSVDLPDDVLRLAYPEMIAAAQPLLPTWLPNFKFMVPDGALPVDWPVEINIHQQLLEYEELPHVSWDAGKCDAYENTGEILHDPTGRIGALVEAKLKAARPGLTNHLYRLLSSGRVVVEIMVRQCLDRGIYHAAHDMMNDVLHNVMVGWYAVNGRFAPVHKWRVVSLRSLPWTPADAAVRYSDLLLVKAHDADDVKRRMAGLLEMLDELQEQCARTWPEWPADPYVTAVHHTFTDRQLRRVTTADELDAVQGLSQEQKMRVAEWNWHNWRFGAGA
ncbi:hypothetical protein ODJ79_19815 [Actinoplanes sp. KI2]|uniref:hypothetical protein n=1 Tax=Actinoplanes sp. KI2 TaxID=2983315 RepID=UPI0021D5D4B2|nr:hypothetical protein [Actinoplanes sp. KI2]MCU7725977.1 hypothetical protein [Actinoplanes sp. KI2]